MDYQQSIFNLARIALSVGLLTRHCVRSLDLQLEVTV